MRDIDPAAVDDPTFNIGVRLYQKGVKRLEERDRYCRQVKEVETLLEGKELLFHPRLVAKPAARGAERSAERTLKKEEELIHYGRMLNQKKEMARVVQE